MNPFLLIERDGAVVTARLNRPETRNALTEPAHMQEIEALCGSIRSDRSVKVLVLTGEGSAFCAGGNVKDMQQRGGIFAGSPYEVRESYRDTIQRIPLALYNLDVPVIAAVNGPAIGAGPGPGLHVRHPHRVGKGLVRRELRQGRHRAR
jgi:enoyl-CoA hydratase/carnithine racemase